MNLRRSLTALLMLLPTAALAVPFSPESSQDILQGRDYTVLETPVPTSTGSQIEVREFFYYGCPHCFDLEEPLNRWLRGKPADVAFVRTPAMLNAKWALMGRAFYVAEDLKVLDKTHAALYNAIHVGNQRELLTDQAAIIKFYGGLGVPADKATAAWDSFAVNTKVKNSEVLARKYLISGTPTVTVNGRYVVPSQGARTFAVVDFLVQKERARLGKK